MTISVNTFSPNTKAESSKINQNFTNVKNAIDQLQADKVMTTLTDLATVTLDLTTTKIFSLTLDDVVGANRTLALSNVTVGQGFMIRLVQGGSGSKTVTWWGGIKWPAATPPTLTTTVGSIDSFGFICTATNVYDGLFLSFDLR
jgi:hypothetical protein